ncbi:MAG: DUF2357 domain-containing protein [Kiritimatiellae bacterium]|nr:DUF2357 domain-containing protein [Kiritimatiellia bacterium]
MAQGVTEVFRAVVPSVGLVLKARGDIRGKQEAYGKRIREDFPEGGEELLTEYSANADCTFSIEGDGREGGAVFAAGGKAVKGPPVFFETRYFFRGDFRAAGGRRVRDVRVEHRMASVADAFNFDEGTLVGTLDFVNEPGKFRLDLRVAFDDGTERTVRLEFMVVSVKMNVARDYGEIVRTIDGERPNIVRAFLSKTFRGAALDRAGKGDERSWYDILLDVFDCYEGACRRIAGNPHRRYVAVADWRRADRIRRWTPGLAGQYGRMDGDRRAHGVFRTERLSPECDTPENRFVLHTLRELERRLREFGGRLKDEAAVSQVWKDGIAERAKRLDRLARHPFFKGVSRFEGFRQQSLVMQKSAGYAQILTAWLKLKAALRPGGEDLDTGYKPISTLYEFWCFLKMRDMLAARFGKPAAETWSDRSAEDLLDAPELSDGSWGGDRLGKIELVFGDGTRTIRLAYQKTYPATEGGDGETMAGLNPQRPDIVLSIEDGESAYTYLFDAKYRIWTKDTDGREIDASPRAAIDDMHRYRDAILYRLRERQVKREAIGAYVLYPGRPEPHLCREYDESLARENIGAIPLLPGHLGQLERRLEDILGKKDAHAHLDGTISTRGTSAWVDGIGGSAGELTLYATSHGASSPKSAWIGERRKYPYPCEEAEKQGIASLEDARKKKILALAAPPRGSRTAAVEVFFIDGVERVRKEELERDGYPSPGHGEYWLFSIRK